MSKKTQFHGILAVGRTQADAVNNYRLLSMGKGATVQVDGAREIAFVTHASSAADMFNPLTGNMDLEADAAMLEKLEFQSNSSDQVEVNHLVCESGCGCHVVCDSEALVKYCPNCTSSLSSDDEELDEDDSKAGSEDEFEVDEDAEESEDDLESDSSDDEDDLSEDDLSEDDLSEDDLESDSEDDLESDSEDEFEVDEDAEESEDEADLESDSSDEPLVVAASSLDEAVQLFSENRIGVSESSETEAHYVLCSSEDCGAHIVSDQPQTECPACHSSVEEPAEDSDEDSEDEAEDEAEVDLESDSSEDDENDEDSDDEDSDDENDEANAPNNTLSPLGEEGDVAEINAAAVVGQDAKVEDLDVSYSSHVAGSSVWTAFYKGTPVAMASKSSADKNADIFDSPAFGHAVLATAKVAGVRKALAELGFQSIKHQVSISSEVRRLVDQQVADAQAALASERTEYQQKFEAALATAAIGINRGFFADVKNPVKEALWNALSAAGIRNPETLIDNAFRTHSDAYHKTLFAQANDIAAKPNEVQESLAKTILGTAYQAVSSTAPESSLEARLSGLGTSVSSSLEENTAPAPNSAAPDMQMIHRAVASLGRRAR